MATDESRGTQSIVIFGATGDLARRKLLPALYNLFVKGRLDSGTRIWGAARTAQSEDEFREHAREAVASASSTPIDPGKWTAFARFLHYRATDLTNRGDLEALHSAVSAETGGVVDNRLYYLSTSPEHYPVLLEHMGATGMGAETRGFGRIVIEKPFGTDLESARRLNAICHASFREDQIFRIDHYLAKETVQNIIVFRFANTLFEPVWNRNYVQAVHVLVAEAVGVEHRAGYYETAGVLRDMFQNHLLQLLTLVAMEPPTRFEADALRNEKLKVLQAITPIDGPRLGALTARGQYEGYRNEPEVNPESDTATYGAMRLHVDNWRWQGVPFVLESGKALKSKITEVVVKFRQPPLQIFRASRGAPTPNAITIRLQPNEGMHVTCQAKEPGEGMSLRPVELDFSYADEFRPGQVAEAYERVLIDALHGDATLFMRSDEIERAWKLIDPIIAGWAGESAPPLELYRRGSWGPPGAERIRGGLVAPPHK